MHQSRPFTFDPAGFSDENQRDGFITICLQKTQQFITFNPEDASLPTPLNLKRSRQDTIFRCRSVRPLRQQQENRIPAERFEKPGFLKEPGFWLVLYFAAAH